MKPLSRSFSKPQPEGPCGGSQSRSGKLPGCEGQEPSLPGDCSLGSTKRSRSGERFCRRAASTRVSAVWCASADRRKQRRHIPPPSAASWALFLSAPTFSHPSSEFSKLPILPVFKSICVKLLLLQMLFPSSCCSVGSRLRGAALTKEGFSNPEKTGLDSSLQSPAQTDHCGVRRVLLADLPTLPQMHLYIY